jgi:TetR/AcrR family transcriptional repressor of nem operon
MARIIKEQEHTVKRNEILDAAQQLVTSKGYEQMTIQDILDTLHISKGALYHYFSSKLALLEALVARMQDEIEQLLLPLIHDPNKPALSKLQCFFSILMQWKTAQKPFLLALTRVWYTDDNALVRQKVRAVMLQRLAPLLTEIIQQGIQEGTLTTAYPDEAGVVVLSLALDLGDRLAGFLLTHASMQSELARVKRIIDAYTDALERVLGMPSASFQLADTPTLQTWFASSDNI